jgi:hypothetical protein
MLLLHTWKQSVEENILTISVPRCEDVNLLQRRISNKLFAKVNSFDINEICKKTA